VREAAVVGIPDPRRGEAVVAFVSSAGAVTPAELVEFCQVRAARFKVPADVVVTLDLPKTPSGKIKKRELREAYLARRKTPSRRPDPITDS
jgi:long-chain acyl-CoA synthetase